MGCGPRESTSARPAYSGQSKEFRRSIVWIKMHMHSGNVSYSVWRLASSTIWGINRTHVTRARHDGVVFH